MENKVNVIVETCAQLVEQEQLQKTVIESAKGAGLTAIATLIGGLLGGKQGMVLGGAVGVSASYLLTSNFKSIPQIIREDMTEGQRRELYRLMRNVLAGLQLTDVATVLQTLAVNAPLKSNVLSTLRRFLSDQMEINI